EDRRADGGRPARRARGATRPHRGLVRRQAPRDAAAARRAFAFATRCRRTATVVLDPDDAQSGGPSPVIVTVTLNAAVDRTLTVPNFQPGHRHRASASLTSAG